MRFATLTYIIVIHLIMGLWLIFSLKLLDKYLFSASMTWLSHRGGQQGFRQSESFVFFEGAYTSIFKQEDEIIGTIPAQCRPGGGRRSCLERKWGAALKKVKISYKCSPFPAYLDFYDFSCTKKKHLRLGHISDVEIVESSMTTGAALPPPAEFCTFTDWGYQSVCFYDGHIYATCLQMLK